MVLSGLPARIAAASDMCSAREPSDQSAKSCRATTERSVGRARRTWRGPLMLMPLRGAEALRRPAPSSWEREDIRSPVQGSVVVFEHEVGTANGPCELRLLP